MVSHPLEPTFKQFTNISMETGTLTDTNLTVKQQHKIPTALYKKRAPFKFWTKSGNIFTSEWKTVILTYLNARRLRLATLLALRRSTLKWNAITIWSIYRSITSPRGDVTWDSWTSKSLRSLVEAGREGQAGRGQDQWVWRPDGNTNICLTSSCCCCCSQQWVRIINCCYWKKLWSWDTNSFYSLMFFNYWQLNN